MVTLLAEIASAFVPVLLLATLVVLIVLGRRLAGYAREVRQLQEDARVFRALLAEGYSPVDADEAVFATRDE